MSSTFTSLFDIFSQFWTSLQHGSVPSLGYWNYVILFFFAIMQGPTVKLLGGAASAKHLLNLYLVFGVSTFATLSMDFFWYRVGRSGKLQHFLSSLSQKKRKYIGAAQRAMQKNGSKVIVMGKFATGMGIPIHVAAGLSKLKWQRWLPATILGESMFTGTLITIGYLMAESLSSASKAVQTTGTVVTVLILAVIWLLLPSRIRKMISAENNEANPE